MEGLIDEFHAAPLAEAQDRVWNAVLEFCGGTLEDDATLLTFHLRDV
jgi:hypothetical protein